MKNSDPSHNEELRLIARKHAANDGHNVNFEQKISHGQVRYEGQCLHCNKYFNYYCSGKEWRYKINGLSVTANSKKVICVRFFSML